MHRSGLGAIPTSNSLETWTPTGEAPDRSEDVNFLDEHRGKIDYTSRDSSLRIYVFRPP